MLPSPLLPLPLPNPLDPSHLFPDSSLRAGAPRNFSVNAREIAMRPTTAKRDSSASPEELLIEAPSVRLTLMILSSPFPDVTTVERELKPAKVPWITVSSPSSSVSS